MFIVIATHPPRAAGPGMFIAPTTSRSGGFAKRDEAGRFAVGLAKSGLAYKTEIAEVNDGEDNPLGLAILARKAAEQFRDSLTLNESSEVMTAIDHLTDAIAALQRHENGKGEEKP